MKIVFKWALYIFIVFAWFFFAIWLFNHAFAWIAIGMAVLGFIFLIGIIVEEIKKLN